MKVTVKVVNQQTHEVECNAMDSLDSLRDVIAELSGIPVPRQRLIFKGHVLETGSLEELGIEDGATIHCVARLPVEQSPSSQPTPTQQPSHEAQAPSPSAQTGIPMGVFAIPVSDDGNVDISTVMRQAMNQIGSIMEAAFTTVSPAPPVPSSNRRPGQPVRGRLSVQISDARPQPTPPSETSARSNPPTHPHEPQADVGQRRGGRAVRDDTLFDAARSLTDAANALHNAAGLISQAATRPRGPMRGGRGGRIDREEPNRLHEMRRCDGTPRDLSRLGYFFPSLSILLRMKGVNPRNLALLAGRHDFLECTLTDLMAAIESDYKEAGVAATDMASIYNSRYYSPLYHYIFHSVYYSVSINNLIDLFIDPSVSAVMIRRCLLDTIRHLMMDVPNLGDSEHARLRRKLIELNGNRLYTPADLVNSVYQSLYSLMLFTTGSIQGSASGEIQTRLPNCCRSAAESMCRVFLSSSELTNLEFSSELRNVVSSTMSSFALMIYEVLLIHGYPDADIVVMDLVVEWGYCITSNSLMHCDCLLIVSLAMFSPHGRAITSTANQCFAMIEASLPGLRERITAGSRIERPLETPSQSLSLQQLPPPVLPAFSLVPIPPVHPHNLVLPPADPTQPSWTGALPSEISAQWRQFEGNEEFHLTDQYRNGSLRHL
ncbi:hypothetical protein RCL1_002474 [Eukaryota sp. TZLM3-RCL]